MKTGSVSYTHLDVYKRQVLLVLNKIDLVKDPGARRIEEDELFKDMSILKISAVRGDGCLLYTSRCV